MDEIVNAKKIIKLGKTAGYDCTTFSTCVGGMVGYQGIGARL